MIKNGILVIKKNDILLLSIVACAVAILFLYSNTMMESILILTILLLLSLMICINSMELLTWNVVALLIINFLSVAISCGIYGGAGVGGVVLGIIACSFVFNGISISYRTYCAVHIFLFLGIMFFLLQYDTSFISAGFLISSSGTIINSNIYGILCLAEIFHAYCVIRLVKIKWIRNVISIVVVSFGTYMILLSRCRSALGALAIFMVMLFVKKGPYTSSVMKKIVIFSLIGSVFFTIIYLYLYNNIENIMFMNKNLFSGRQYIWEDVYIYIKKYPIFGSGNRYGLNTGGNSITYVVHNMILSVMKTVGIIPTITIIFCLYRDKKKIQSKECVDTISQYAFISSLFIAYNENFMTDSHLYIPFLFFLLMNVEDMEVSGEKNQFFYKKHIRDFI